MTTKTKIQIGSQTTTVMILCLLFWSTKSEQRRTHASKADPRSSPRPRRRQVMSSPFQEPCCSSIPLFEERSLGQKDVAFLLMEEVVKKQRGRRRISRVLLEHPGCPFRLHLFLGMRGILYGRNCNLRGARALVLIL